MHETGPSPPAACAVERATPFVLGSLSIIFTCITFAVHVDPGRFPEPETRPPAVRAGLRLWRERNCSACHQVYGLGGFLGPDLTNAYSRRGPRHIRHVLLDGFGNMPSPGLGGAEADALVEYLRSVDRTGEYPQRPGLAKPFPN